jgi:exopolysaccharide biosynthesis polyprenyl glycosylphosphotransferase
MPRFAEVSALMLEVSQPEAESAPPAAAHPRFIHRPADSGIGEARSPVTVRRREALTHWMLAGADMAATWLTAIASSALFGWDRVGLAALALLPAVLLVSKLSGLYDRDELVLHKATLDEVPALFQLATLYTLLVTVLAGTLVRGGLGAVEVFVLWGTFLVALVLCRWAARACVRSQARPERCLCIGDTQVAEPLRDRLRKGRRVKAEVVAVLPLGEDGEPAIDGQQDLGALVRSLDVHRVIITPRSADSEAVLEVVCMAKALGVRVSILPRIFEVVGSSVRFDDVDGMTMLGVRRFGLTHSSELVKRGFDLMGASLVLLLSAPALALAAVAIKLDSPGPVFFRQTRVGRDGRRFQIIKFRTMVRDAEARKDALRGLNETDGLFKIERDPRVTRVGRLLRRTSLDELPQLVNVLRGEMSLVGPRPLVVEEDRQVQGWHRRRLHLTPGVTGHWQILGSGRIPLQEMVKIDYLYLASWSLWLDAKILLRTVAHVLRRRGM